MKGGGDVGRCSGAAPADSSGRDALCAEERLAVLMAGYQAADWDSVEQLVERLSPRLLRFFQQQAKADAGAEDLLLECWIRLHKYRRTYRPGAPFLPWVYAIAKTTAVNGGRRRRRFLAFEQSSWDGNPESAPSMS